MTDKYQVLRDGLPELQREAARKGGHNPRAQLIIDLLAERDQLAAAQQRWGEKKMIKKKPKNFDYALAYWKQYVGKEVVVVHTIYHDAFQKGVSEGKEISKGTIVSVYRELGNKNSPIIIWYTDHKTFMSSFYPEVEDEGVNFEIT